MAPRLRRRGRAPDQPYGFDLGVAAGYMLIFTDVLYQRG
jgi:hypothetical protein